MPHDGRIVNKSPRDLPLCACLYSCEIATKCVLNEIHKETFLDRHRMKLKKKGLQEPFPKDSEKLNGSLAL